MRLSETTLRIIETVVGEGLSNAPGSLYLFGSRSDDNKRGVDIDLLLLVKNSDRLACSRLRVDILVALQQRLGERRVDLIVSDEAALDTDPFLKMIRPTAVELRRWRPPAMSQSSRGEKTPGRP